ncbi:MAG: hypothetical protein HZB68_02210 [Candidatus Aenigmarchaeota archaeon]|nr:hypothetical protein [Candidatus Aenigmarchaeota archaeon]
MQNFRKGMIKKVVAGAGLAALIGVSAMAAVPMRHAEGFWAQAKDNPELKEIDYYVTQHWNGKETAGYINDNWVSTIGIYEGSGTTKINKESSGFFFGTTTYKSVVSATGKQIGEMSLEDHGTGEKMSATAIDYAGKDAMGQKFVIGGWNEQVERGSWGPFFTGVFDMTGVLIGYSGQKPTVIMPEKIPLIGSDNTVRVGFLDNNGNIKNVTESVSKRAWDGWLSWNQREGTNISTVKLDSTGKNAVPDQTYALSKRDWMLGGAFEKSEVKDAKGNTLYTVKAHYFDKFMRSLADGYKIFDKNGKLIAEIDIDDPDNVKQLGYRVLVDKNMDGKMDKSEEVGKVFFYSTEINLNPCTGSDSDSSDCDTKFDWTGEAWFKLAGKTPQEKLQNLKAVDNVFKLLQDIVPVDNDSATFNIEEYTDFLTMFLDRNTDGTLKSIHLANAATAADTADYKKALDEIVYSKLPTQKVEYKSSSVNATKPVTNSTKTVKPAAKASAPKTVAPKQPAKTNSTKATKK